MLTKKLVEKAISLVTPTALEVLSLDGATWGPKWVAVVIMGDTLPEPVVATIGEVEEWQAAWGEEVDFEEVATRKADLALRTGLTSRLAVETHPWLLQKGEFFWAGGVVENGLAVGVSGARAHIDEGLAWLNLNAVHILCMNQIANLQKDGINQL